MESKGKTKGEREEGVGEGQEAELGRRTERKALASKFPSLIPWSEIISILSGCTQTNTMHRGHLRLHWVISQCHFLGVILRLPPWPLVGVASAHSMDSKKWQCSRISSTAYSLEWHKLAVITHRIFTSQECLPWREPTILSPKWKTQKTRESGFG